MKRQNTSVGVYITLTDTPVGARSRRAKRATATALSREGASGIGLAHPAKTPPPVALLPRPILKHPARTPPPAELRVSASEAVSGRRVVGGRRSPYASALGARIERQGATVELRARLEELRRAVLAGHGILNVVADGTLWGWQTRMALQHELHGLSLADWDAGRTEAERLALIERVLAQLVGAEPKRKGGWRVSR